MVEGRASSTASGKSASAFRTISEVSDQIDVPQHVLRFWETKFNQIRPLKRGGGRRYYRPEDIELLQRIRDWLYAEGYTIKGVQKLLRDRGSEPGGNDKAKPDAASAVAPPRHLSEKQRTDLTALLDDLTELRDRVRRGPQ